MYVYSVETGSIWCPSATPFLLRVRSKLLSGVAPAKQHLFVEVLCTMADAALYALVWDEERIKEALAEASKEVKFLWGQFKISLQTQARLAELGPMSKCSPPWKTVKLK